MAMAAQISPLPCKIVLRRRVVWETTRGVTQKSKVMGNHLVFKWWRTVAHTLECLPGQNHRPKYNTSHAYVTL